MFNKKLIVVVGAGASHEYGLPLGSGLKSQISKSLDLKFEFNRITQGSPEIVNAIRRSFKGQENKYHAAARELSKAIPLFVSIDEALHFLSSSKEAVFTGKLAIAHHVLAAEKKCSLKIDPGTGQPTLPDGGSWLPVFTSMASAGLKKDNLSGAFRNVIIINFNYDRTIESFIYWSLRLRASLSAQQAADIVSNIQFIRPYGSLGNLDWHRNRGTPFGGDPYNEDRPEHFAELLRTYTEQDSLDCQDVISEAIEEAHVIIMLGFGFHPQNSDLIRSKTKNKSVKVLATMKGIHSGNVDSIASRLASNLGCHKGNLTLLDFTASELLANLRPMILSEMQ